MLVIPPTSELKQKNHKPGARLGNLARHCQKVGGEEDAPCSLDLIPSTANKQTKQLEESM